MSKTTKTCLFIQFYHLFFCCIIIIIIQMLVDLCWAVHSLNHPGNFPDKSYPSCLHTRINAQLGESIEIECQLEIMNPFAKDHLFMYVCSIWINSITSRVQIHWIYNSLHMTSSAVGHGIRWVSYCSCCVALMMVNKCCEWMVYRNNCPYAVHYVRRTGDHGQTLVPSPLRQYDGYGLHSVGSFILASAYRPNGLPSIHIHKHHTHLCVQYRVGLSLGQ